MLLIKKIERAKFFRTYKKALLNSIEKPCNDKSNKLTGTIVEVCLYDALNNKTMNKLMRKISKLDGKKFKVTTHIKQRPLRVNNFVFPQFDHKAIGILAEITPLSDSFVRRIIISQTQINNEETVLEYSFQFARSIRSISDYREKVLAYWDIITSLKCARYYKNVAAILQNDGENTDYIYILFLSIFQGFINDKLYTNLGKNHQLPINVVNLVKKSSVVSKIIKECFVLDVYKKQKEKTYLINNKAYDKWVNETIVIGDKYSHEGLLHYFMDYGMDYYYQIFSEIEINELSSKLVGYFNKEKTRISLINRKWLLRKFRRVSEIKLFSLVDKKPSGIIGVTKSNKDSDYVQFGVSKKFSDVYENNLKYIDSVYGLSDIHVWKWILLGISVAGLIVSILGLIL